MNTLNPTQVERFKALFPELPEELADVVLLYAAGATQADIAAMAGLPSRKQVACMLKSAAEKMELGSVQAIRIVVQNRLYFFLLDCLRR